MKSPLEDRALHNFVRSAQRERNQYNEKHKTLNLGSKFTFHFNYIPIRL